MLHKGVPSSCLRQVFYGHSSGGLIRFSIPFPHFFKNLSATKCFLLESEDFIKIERVYKCYVEASSYRALPLRAEF